MQKCQLPSGGESEEEKEKMHSLLFPFFSFFFLFFVAICQLPGRPEHPLVYIIDSELLSPRASPIQRDLVHTEEAELALEQDEEIEAAARDWTLEKNSRRLTAQHCRQETTPCDPLVRTD